MEFALWIVFMLRVLKAMLPVALTIGLTAFVMCLAGSIPGPYVLPALIFTAIFIGAFLRNQVFHNDRPQRPRYREYLPRRQARIDTTRRRRGFWE